MGKFDDLTKYIPLLKDDPLGEWVYDRKNDGSHEHPKVFPHVEYSDTVAAFNKDFIDFCLSHREYGYFHFEETLQANHIGDRVCTVRDAYAPGLDAGCIIAMITCAMKSERYCEGSLLSYLKEGFVLQWLERLKEIDENVIFRLETRRLNLRVASKEEMEALIEAQTDAELKKAYREMLQGCLDHPDLWEWYAVWVIERKEDGIRLGDLSFKGLNADGSVEIGYGIDEEFQGNGFATEAVYAATVWALLRPGVIRVEAETDPDNIASQRVLEKCGFVPTGTFGEEGPRYVIDLDQLRR